MKLLWPIIIILIASIIGLCLAGQYEVAIGYAIVVIVAAFWIRHLNKKLDKND
jgi:hypothetical protein